MKKALTLILLFLFTGHFLHAQISPPGLGDAHTASWYALGVKHKLDTLGKKYSLTYIAFGRKSNLEQNNPFAKQAIFVLNNEIYNSFAPHQQYSYAFSYRRQPEYASEAPYQRKSMEQEFRLYGRYAYAMQLGNKLKLKSTIRQEFRKFFDPDFHIIEENFQLRTRLKNQISYKLFKKSNQQLAFSVEELFSISYLSKQATQWTSFGYRETRIAAYYMFTIPNSPFNVDIGYMNDLIRNSKSLHQGGVHYLAADLIWNL